MQLKTGKLPPALLKKLLRHRGAHDARVLVGPSVGEDAAVVRLGKHLLVLKTDPVSYASDLIGWYAVNVNANDVATRGAVPAWFQATVLLPPGSDEALAESIFKQISSAARRLGIAVTGGHTEVTPGIEHPIVVGDMHGLLDGRRPVLTSGAKAGDAIVLTKGAGIEGTALIARERRDELSRRLGPAVVARAADFLFRPGLSVVPEARLALEHDVSAMHDPTEGGVAMGAYELSEASGRLVEIDLDAVMVRRETALVCEVYDLDPMGLLGSGALLATFRPRDAEDYVNGLRGKRIASAVVGKVLPGKPGVRALRRGRDLGETSRVVDCGEDLRCDGPRLHRPLAERDACRVHLAKIRPEDAPREPTDYHDHALRLEGGEGLGQRDLLAAVVERQDRVWLQRVDEDVEGHALAQLEKSVLPRWHYALLVERLDQPDEPEVVRRKPRLGPYGDHIVVPRVYEHTKLALDRQVGVEAQEQEEVRYVRPSPALGVREFVEGRVVVGRVEQDLLRGLASRARVVLDAPLPQYLGRDKLHFRVRKYEVVFCHDNTSLSKLWSFAYLISCAMRLPVDRPGSMRSA